jgi:glycine/D-amino acid oxidase-like deaminating enzyme
MAEECDDIAHGVRRQARMVPRSAEVVIVGAGAIGCSIAYHLAQRGQSDVVVLERASVRSGWAGLRPLTPDEHAIVDWLPGVPGVCCAVGFCGHGFQHAPATGRQVAAWLLDGQPSLDLSPLGFARFAGRDTAVRGSLLSGVD